MPTAPIKYSSKGIQLEVTIASVLTPIPCMDTLNLPPVKPQTVDATTLDGLVGMEHKPTGYADGGMCTGSLFIDPGNVVHKALLALLGAPAVIAWKAILPDAAATGWTFNGTLTEFGGVTAKVNEFLKSNLEVTLDGIPTYPP